MRKLWSWVTWLTLLTVLAFSSPALTATYYLRNDGTGADPDCSGSSACCAGAYNEAGYNAATFSASDVVKICPHGGNFDLGIDIDATVGVTHEGVYDAQYGWPVFDEGVTLSGNSNTLMGIGVRPGVAESGVSTFEGGRFGECDNGNRTWQAAEETAVTDWAKTDTGLFAVGIGGTGGATTPTPQLYWRNVTDAGSFAAVSASGEVKYTDPGGCLTDEADLTTSEFGTSSGKAKITGVDCEQENSHQASSSTSLATDEYTELQVGISFADGDSGDQYAFSLYESGSPIGSASAATVTLEVPCTMEQQFEDGTTQIRKTQGDWSGTQWVASSFTSSGSSYDLTKIKIWLRKTGSPNWNLTLKVYSDNGSGKPNNQQGSDSTNTLATTSITTSCVGYEFLFNPITLSGSTRYHTIVYGDSYGDGSNSVSLCGDAGSESEYLNQSSSGSSWTITHSDQQCRFETYLGNCQ